ncbi:hypothetical protein GCM10009785_32070 [Brooklawnia cerclae]|uniref:Clp R domain-containing protein n=1 Tax=Brooklawnia cerclae TaxID=349934 RepID=A0ABX0SIN3_9ACTN|nr:hypothetical protein [Brooklawnia cerclae]NIH56501.1 hypothetical protein [Brooklawnia cerclae]
MFNRFANGAREAVTAAVAQAHDMGHTTLGAGHLLIGACTADDQVTAVLGRHGVDAAALRRGMSGEGFAGLSITEVDALESIGIDVPQLVREIGPLPSSRKPWSSRRSGTRGGGAMEFSPGAKKALEAAVVHVKGTRGRPVTPAVVAACCLDDPRVHALVEKLGAAPARIRGDLLAQDADPGSGPRSAV